jgi:hypothetical protein
VDRRLELANLAYMNVIEELTSTKVLVLEGA